MEQLAERAELLGEQIRDAWDKLLLDKVRLNVEKLEKKVAAPSYWQETDNQQAQEESKQLADLKEMLEPWQALRNQVDEIVEFAQTGDVALIDELSQKLTGAETSYEKLKNQLRYNGKHDRANAVVSIQAGAGGLDAQDWAAMLQRMYVRWAENSSYAVTLLSESYGEEKGIKAASFIVKGPLAYGNLRGEHGVHRLVRLSPFNSAGSRETSFAMVEVIPEIDSPKEIEIDENELKIDVYRAGGHGGQSVNTTDSAVRITHLPTSISVSIQNERSQTQNKETAMKVLASRLANLAEEQHKEKIADLKGPNLEAAWGNQIRSYVLHPYTLVKDNRSGYQTTDVEGVLNGGLEQLIDAYLDFSLGNKA